MEEDSMAYNPNSEKHVSSNKSIEQTNEEITPFEILKTKVYPVINQVILKLIDHIVKSEEVTKHEERLKKKKVIDELEKKYIQRDIERQEMGSDYQESDDQQAYNILGMGKEVVEPLVRKRIAKHNNKILDDDDDQEISGNIFNPIDFIVKELKAYQLHKAP